MRPYKRPTTIRSPGSTTGHRDKHVSVLRRATQVGLKTSSQSDMISMCASSAYTARKVSLRHERLKMVLEFSVRGCGKIPMRCSMRQQLRRSTDRQPQARIGTDKKKTRVSLRRASDSKWCLKLPANVVVFSKCVHNNKRQHYYARPGATS